MEGVIVAAFTFAASAFVWYQLRRIASGLGDGSP